MVAYSLPLYGAKPAWEQLYAAAWATAVGNLKTPARKDWKQQMTCMPSVERIWAWDSCFMTFYAAYGNGVVPVMNNLDNLYSVQREDGFIGMAYSEAGELSFGERINPPLFAWAEARYWQSTGDASRLERVLPRLVAFYRWIEANRRYQSGLYWFEDAGSTGMDNAPRSSYASPALNGDGICHIDLACQQALAAEQIALIAEAVGQADLKDVFSEAYAGLKTTINRYHWDEKTGFYYDLFSRSSPELRHNFLNHKTAASFWPLVAGICNAEQAERLVAHLTNPTEFWTSHPVATLSQDDPNYDPTGGFWLGGVWAPINYMVAKGLERYGYDAIARELAVAHLDAMSQVLADPAYGSIYEAYAPEGVAPARHSDGRQVRSEFVGWSGLGPIAMFVENILGIRRDTLARRIVWDHATVEPHGIDNLALGESLLSLHSSGQKEREELELAIETPTPFTLELWLEGEQRELAIRPEQRHYRVSLKDVPTR